MGALPWEPRGQDCPQEGERHATPVHFESGPGSHVLPSVIGGLTPPRKPRMAWELNKTPELGRPVRSPRVQPSLDCTITIQANGQHSNLYSALGTECWHCLLPCLSPGRAKDAKLAGATAWLPALAHQPKPGAHSICVSEKGLIQGSPLPQAGAPRPHPWTR